jgi:ribosomal protein S27E
LLRRRIRCWSCSTLLVSVKNGQDEILGF